MKYEVNMLDGNSFQVDFDDGNGNGNQPTNAEIVKKVISKSLEEYVPVGLCEASFEVNHAENKINFTLFPDQKLYLDDKDLEDPKKYWSEEKVMESRGFVTFLFDKLKQNEIGRASLRQLVIPKLKDHTQISIIETDDFNGEIVGFNTVMALTHERDKMDLFHSNTRMHAVKQYEDTTGDCLQELRAAAFDRLDLTGRQHQSEVVAHQPSCASWCDPVSQILRFSFPCFFNRNNVGLDEPLSPKQ